MADDLYQAGFQVGQTWAAKAFDDIDRRDQLFNLESLRAGYSNQEWADLFEQDGYVVSPSETLFNYMYFGEPWGEDEMMEAHQQFEQSVFGQNNPHINNPAYLRGFAEGALATWSKVKPNT